MRTYYTFFLISCIFLLIFALDKNFLSIHEKSMLVRNVIKRPLIVVCTTNIIADAVHAIAGDKIIVHTLMGPGVDPHMYRARESDVHKLAAADIIFYNGLHLEGKMGLILKNMHSYKHTVAVTDALPATQLRLLDTATNTADPHVWLDVTRWITCVRSIGAVLADADPTHATEYTNGTCRYVQQLTCLDNYVRSTIQKLPKNKRILVTAHDAFGYFGLAYGFTVVGLQGISTESETAISDIRKLVAFLIAHQIPAMFVESSIPQRSLEAVQYAAASQGWPVKIGPELYTDSLGPLDSPAQTYSGMIQHNINAIVTTLLD